jgi:rhodanese-related sulfurtransferase
MLTPAPLSSIPLTDDRRRFLHHVLCHAQVEFSRLESPPKVIGSALLTAMGALGAACGFSGWRPAETDHIQVVGRGLDHAAIRSIERNVDHLMACCFENWKNAPDPIHRDIRIFPAPADLPALPGLPAVRILIGWQMAPNMAGLMGIGATLRDTSFADSEIGFLYHLVDHMLMAIRAIADNSLIHTLTNELDQARQKASESDSRIDTTKMELEETRFRLSGFNDIFDELSGLTESAKVMDAFLLVMLGIFSAQSGAILYADDTTGKTHAAMRGVGTTTRHGQPAEIRETLETLFGSSFGFHAGDAQVTAMPPEQCKGLERFAPRSNMAILFQIDADARGVLCLGKRLVETQYGAKEQELLLAFTHTFLAFLKNSRSFETIARLHADQQQKTIALEKTVQALSESRLTIAGLEKAGERIKTAITRSMMRTARVSLLDIALILLAGTMLGVVYNFASPSGIPLAPRVWRYPPPGRINIDDARARLVAGEILIVDARPAEFFNQRHIRDALSLPLALFDFVYMMRFSQMDPQRPIVVYGRNISRHYDEELAYKLTQRGHPHVFVLAGGVAAWQAKGFEVSP